MADKDKFEEFSITEEKEKIHLRVNLPVRTDYDEARKVYNQAFYDAVQSKAMLRTKLDDFMKQQGVWDDTKEAAFQRLQKEVNEAEKRLHAGGFYVGDGEKLAKEIKLKRLEMRDMLSVRASLDNNTAEGQADNMQFNYLVAACLVYKKDGKKYFSGLDDYLNRATEPASILAAQKLSSMLYGLGDEFERNLPENEFLKNHGFVDDQLRFVNKEGHLIDEEGRLVNEEGRFVDENDNYVDIDGNPVTEDGNFAFEQKPFIDEDGNPIILDEKRESESQKNVTTKENNLSKTNVT